MTLKPFPDVKGYVGPDIATEFICMKEGEKDKTVNNFIFVKFSYRILCPK